MNRRIKYLLYKDFLMLRRDIGGIILMFLMPVLLVMLMANLQDSTLNFVKGNKIPLLLVNSDSGELGAAVVKEIESSGLFDIEFDTTEAYNTPESMEDRISPGDNMIGIFIPEDATKRIRGNVQKFVIGAFNGINDIPLDDIIDITVLVDPAAKGSFHTVLMSTLRERSQKVQFEYIMREISNQVNDISPVAVNTANFSGEQFRIEDKFVTREGSNIMPNSVQHNVPAWSLFAIFFIVVSLAGNIIKEREGGSFTRLLTMPCTYAEYLISKSAIYLIVALIQFTLMLLIGVYVLPLTGLPALELGHSLTALFFIGFSVAVAAIGYGIAIGNIARTHQQASVFGAVSVVILAAIGGVWIPLFLMSPQMQLISKLSPMNWGMSGFYSIFLRDEGLLSVLPESFALLLFGVACFMLALYSRNKMKMFS
ncbi:MAG: ABC transporter permease [Bacteroidales bacterium]|nr:ABC transporter permease [Bacteroidales bacterium]